ncbi:MAG: DHHA1 domain-containing protein [Desulfovibrionaceae bacterium]|nr:DHHA1 domain-containing protein [Desulfovibrionaceae bacterium]
MAAQIAAVLRERDNILAAAHASPDGDAIGATAAMGWLLQSLGKRFALYNASGMPASYAWVKMPQPLIFSLEGLSFTPELLVALDCGDAHRLGPELARLLATLPSVNLDHHPGNPHFGSLGNWVDPDMAATGQLVAEVARVAGVPLSGGLAEGVCLSLVSDTGSFAFGNAGVAVFRLMAELVDGGLDFAGLRERMDRQWSLARSCLWGRLLGKVESRCGGRLILCVIRREDMDACAAAADDLEGFVELLRRHRGAELAATLREDAPDRCKLSLRSFGGVDARALASRFGGGGHQNAAGATMHEAVDGALEKVIALACAMFGS